MNFMATDATGVTRIATDPHRDCRGFFPCWFGTDDFIECDDFTAGQTDISCHLQPGHLVNSVPSNAMPTGDDCPGPPTYRRQASGLRSPSGAKP